MLTYPCIAKRVAIIFWLLEVDNRARGMELWQSLVLLSRVLLLLLLLLLAALAVPAAAKIAQANTSARLPENIFLECACRSL